MNGSGVVRGCPEGGRVSSPLPLGEGQGEGSFRCLANSPPSYPGRVPGAKRSDAPDTHNPSIFALLPSYSVSRPSRGFTLLEVLLTLLLASLVLVALAMAIDFQLRVVDRSRRNVEEGQLARVLLSRIANDLRGAVPYDPLDMESLVAEAMAAAKAAGAGSGQDAGESAGEAAAAASPEDSEMEDTDAEEVEDSNSDETAGAGGSVVPRSVPGLYGGSDWIQVDVSRLPRLDQFEYLLTSVDGSTRVDRLSDVKTVTYYVVPPDDESAGHAADGTESGGGLVRSELDRAVASWASDQGGLDETDSDGPPIAPEVTAIQFRYSDGTEWVDEWDSDEAGAFPVAVEITMTITPSTREASEVSSWQTSAGEIASDEENALTYRLVVRLPAYQASSGEGASGETAETEETGTTEESAETAEPESSQNGSLNEEPTR